MKKLLATTAMCLVFATGLHGVANATETATIVCDTTDLASTATKNVLMVEMSLYRGDFQQIARSVSTTEMYSGIGSALMVSVRMSPY